MTVSVRRQISKSMALIKVTGIQILLNNIMRQLYDFINTQNCADESELVCNKHPLAIRLND